MKDKIAVVTQVARRILDDFKEIDILVNNAGASAVLLGKLGNFKDTTEDIWSWVIDLNLNGTHIGRNGGQDEVAALVSFSVSPEADYITGSNYTIDGARVLGSKIGASGK